MHIFCNIKKSSFLWNFCSVWMSVDLIYSCSKVADTALCVCNFVHVNMITYIMHIVYYGKQRLMCL